MINLSKEKYKAKDVFNIPNLISLFRLSLAYPMYYYLDKIQSDDIYRSVIIGLILIAFISDILDGLIARKLNIITETGKIVDPLADKVLMIIIVFKLFLLNEIPPIYFWIIIGRDLLIFSGGIFVTKKIGQVLPSNLLGKLTVLFIGFFILATVIGINSYNIFYRILFYVSIILSFASVIGYALRAYEKIKWKNNEHI